MAGKTFTTTISIGGEVEASVQQAFARTSKDLEAIQKAAAQAAGATDKLSTVIDQQSEELEKAKKAYTDYILGGETSSKKVKELEDEIKRLNKELNKNKKKFSEAQNAANDCADGCSNAKETVGKLTNEFNKWGTSAKKVLTVTATSILALGTAVLALGPATTEYRQNQGQLNAAFKQAQLSSEAATLAYRQLYKVIGDDDQAVESAVNIAMLASSEQDAAKWAELASGILGTFHDTLQPEAFYEAANETLKLGEATGAFTQMLEQTGVMSVEEFNKKLAACTTEAEKQAFMLDVSQRAMGQAGAAYDEATASIQAQRDAQAKLNKVMAEVGEAVSPISTALTELGADVLAQLTPYIEEFAEKYLPDIVAALSDVGTAIGETISWIADNWKLVSTLATIILGIAAAISVVSTVMGIVNAVMLVSPVTWIVLGIVAAIAALVAIIVVCVKYWDEIKLAAVNAWEWIKGAWSSAGTWLNEKVVQPIGNFFTSMWDGIKLGIDGMISFFTTGFNSLVGIVKAPINGVVAIINGAIDAINSIGFDIPDWVPLIGGQKFSIDIPKLPQFATGGITNGTSIAGEDPRYPHEYIISLNPAYRSQNLSYWAQAGRMLGADEGDFLLGGSSGVNLGGVTFSPNITINGRADKETIMAAIEAEYPEFVDMLDEYLMSRGVTVYA